MKKNFSIVHKNRLKSHILKKWKEILLAALFIAFFMGSKFSWLWAGLFFLSTAIISSLSCYQYYKKKENQVMETVFALDKEFSGNDFFPTAFETKIGKGVIFEQITDLTEQYFAKIFASENVCIVKTEIKDFLLKKFLPSTIVLLLCLLLFKSCSDDGKNEPNTEQNQNQNANTGEQQGDGQQGDGQQGDGQQGDGQQGEGQQGEGQQGEGQQGDGQQGEKLQGEGQQSKEEQNNSNNNNQKNENNRFDPKAGGNSLAGSPEDEIIPFSDDRQLKKGQYQQSNERLEAVFSNPNLPASYKKRLRQLFGSEKK